MLYVVTAVVAVAKIVLTIICKATMKTEVQLGIWSLTDLVAQQFTTCVLLNALSLHCPTFKLGVIKVLPCRERISEILCGNAQCTWSRGVSSGNVNSSCCYQALPIRTRHCFKHWKL